MMYKFFNYIFIALLILTLSPNAFTEEQLAKPSSSPKTLQVRLLTDPATFDWNIASSHMETRVLMNIMEGLFEFDSKMQIKPALAESYKLSADKTLYTIKLKKNVHWSDGKPLTAKDFIYSWQRLLNPLTGAPYAYFLFYIKGSQEYHQGKIRDFNEVGIHALDDFTIRVQLKKPVSFFLQMFTFWVTFPVRKDLVEKFGKNWSHPKNIQTLGPFVLTDYAPQKQIQLRRNTHYYRKKPTADKVILRIVDKDSTAANLFHSGKLDFVMPISPLEAGELVKTNAYHSVPYWRIHYLGFNTHKPPFDNKMLRKAIAMAIDKSKFGKILQQNKPAAHSFVPPQLFPEGRQMDFSFDPPKARSLLKESGIDVKKLRPLTFLTYASDENSLLSQYIQGQLKKNLGITVQIRMPEYKTYKRQIDLEQADLYYLTWGADYADPDTFFGIFLSQSGNNKIHWKNKNYDSLIEKAASISIQKNRTKLYTSAQNILIQDEVVIVPLHFNSLTYLLNPEIKNFIINPLNYVYFRDIVFNDGN